MMKSEGTQEMSIIRGRQISALLNPRPVVLVTCCDFDRKPNVLPVAWHTPLSHDPPMVGISINSCRFSHQLIKDTRQFAINVVDRSIQRAVEICGNSSGEYVDKFSEAGLSLLPAHTIAPPLIAGALAHLECTVENELPAGTHTLFIGLVRYAEVYQTCFTDHWLTDGGKVLLCLQRDRFATWA